jgi:hypothetical protein
MGTPASVKHKQRQIHLKKMNPSQGAVVVKAILMKVIIILQHMYVNAITITTYIQFKLSKEKGARNEEHQIRIPQTRFRNK